jgi:hypothetical protein
MKKGKSNDSLFESFKNQKGEVKLSKIYGGTVEPSIGSKSYKTLMMDGSTIQDQAYQPD